MIERAIEFYYSNSIVMNIISFVTGVFIGYLTDVIL